MQVCRGLCPSPKNRALSRLPKARRARENGRGQSPSPTGCPAGRRSAGTAPTGCPGPFPESTENLEERAAQGPPLRDVPARLLKARRAQKDGRGQSPSPTGCPAGRRSAGTRPGPVRLPVARCDWGNRRPKGRPCGMSRPVSRKHREPGRTGGDRAPPLQGISAVKCADGHAPLPGLLNELIFCEQIMTKL